MKDTVVDAMKDSIRIERENLELLEKSINYSELEQAVDLISAARMTITCASGTSGIAAAKLAHSLCCIERPAKYMPPHEATSGGLGVISPEDVVVVVSRGGKTAELLPIISSAKERGAYLIGVTENSDSTLAEASDVVLQMHISGESDPLGVMATGSYIVTISIFDALLSGLITRTGFTSEQFGRIHPAGAVGQMLGNQHSDARS